MATHEDPVGLLGLRGVWQEVRPLVVSPENAADLLVAVAPVTERSNFANDRDVYGPTG